LITGLQLRAVTPESIGRSLSAQGTSLHSLVVGWRPARMPAVVSSPKGAHFVLIADARGFAASLSQALGDHGALCTVIAPADPMEIHASLLACLRREAGSPVSWIVDCTALDADPPIDPWRSIPPSYHHLLAVAQALEIAGSQAGLCVITRGAQAVAPGDDVNLTQASLLGLARSIVAERSQTPMLRLDLDPAARPDEAIVLQALAAAAASEPELGVRNGKILAPRLQESSAPAVSDDGMRDVLRIRQRGSFEALEVLHEARRRPGPGEVEIAVRAAGLNFRDVLNTLGMYPGDAGPLGSECSGVVVAAGDGVTHLRAGDEVVAFAIDSMASHVTTSAAMVVRKPESIGFAAAVTVPNAYLTAACSLHNAAGISAGQRVLIHAAAGGVGLAALRLARRAGAEVIATAGTEEKRAVALAEGASHAFDSRSPGFADDVLRVTGGAGVDIVLNSLAGDLIAAGMRCLPRGGCFVEIGKSGIWSTEEAALRAPGVRYVIVDLGRAIQDDAPAVGGRLEHIFEEIELGSLEPLPVRAFPLSAAVDAFGHMAAARHVGKIVLVPERSGSSAPPVLASGTYLVTGGLGGLGLATANWLSSRGAGEIVLVGRRAPAPADESQLERIRAAGTRVTVVSCDIGDPESVRALWRDVLDARPPLRGIVHAAGVNADAPLHRQDAARFDEVARAKILGAWLLHEYSSKSPLDFFVLYSSASALFGSAGQANYAAANSFLDGLAAYRRAHGLCATSVAWGAWDKVGMAARTSEATRAHWAGLGIGFLSPEEAFPALERALEAAVSHVAILAIDPQRAAAQATPGVRALFGLHGSAPSSTTDSTRGVAGDRADIRVNLSVADLRDAAPAARPGMVETYLRAEAARVLGFRAERLDTALPLASFGFDSLMAVQLKNRIEIDLRAALPMTDFLQGSSVGQLAVTLLQMVDSSASGPDAAVVGADAWEEGSL
jgi:NADPH:quinone reductase-like Zn-dependent oxidoreductase